MPLTSTAARVRRLTAVAALALTTSLSGVGTSLAWAEDGGATTIDDSAVGPGDNSVSYAGSWRAAARGGTAHSSGTQGSSLAIRFTGSSISLYGARTGHWGVAAVAVDDGPFTAVEFHRRHRAPVYSVDDLGGGGHVLRLVVLNGPRGGSVSFDKAVVGPAAARTVDDSSTDTQADGSSTDPAATADPTSADPTSADSTSADSTGTGSTTTDPTATATPSTAVPHTASAAAAGASASGDFVTRNGTQLQLGGQPFQFVGLNAVYMLGCSNSTTAVSSIENYFSSMGPGHVDRVWVLPGTDLAQVDRVVAAAKAAGSRVYLSLADGGGACADPGGRKSADWYNGGWRATHEAHIRSVVTRYKDDPTVAFWELINESSGDAGAVRRFSDDAGALIKSLDGNHLVESGTMPSYAFGGDDGWKTANGSAAVDITSIHEYDDETVESHWLLNALPLTQALGKPVVVGEFGVEASPSGSSCAHSFTDRAALVARKLDAYLAHPEVAGADYWAYEGNVDGCDVGTPPSDTGLLNAVKAKAATLR